MSNNKLVNIILEIAGIIFISSVYPLLMMQELYFGVEGVSFFGGQIVLTLGIIMWICSKNISHKTSKAKDI